jgi:Fe-S-cluster containining protein
MAGNGAGHLGTRQYRKGHAVSLRSQQRQLRAIYDQIPDVPCTGACTDTCTSFPVPRIEKRIIRRATGVDLGSSMSNPITTRCPLLTPAGRCAAHDIRPLICRLWGACDLMPCVFGCAPAQGRRLTAREANRLSAQVFEISGQNAMARAFRDLDVLPDEVLGPVAPALAALFGSGATEATIVEHARALLRQMTR